MEFLGGIVKVLATKYHPNVIAMSIKSSLSQNDIF